MVDSSNVGTNTEKGLKFIAAGRSLTTATYWPCDDVINKLGPVYIGNEKCYDNRYLEHVCKRF
jgi:hypothetical protein